MVVRSNVVFEMVRNHGNLARDGGVFEGLWQIIVDAADKWGCRDNRGFLVAKVFVAVLKWS